MMYTTSFTVVGKGMFPLVMLMRDDISPVGQSDVDAIYESFGHYVTSRVRLWHHDRRPGWMPNITQWAHEGWTVEMQSISRVNVNAF